MSKPRDEIGPPNEHLRDALFYAFGDQTKLTGFREAYDLAMQEQSESLLDRMRKLRELRLAERDTQIRDALCRWVSEIEPCLIFRRDDIGHERFIGLGIAGRPGVLVPAKAKANGGIA